jgi:UDP-glucuronate decarboxylase
VNIGNSDEYPVLDLGRLVLDVTGSASEIRFEPLPVDDPTQRRPDLTLASEWLGWRPEVPFVEGLRRTATYFEQVLAGQSEASSASTGTSLVVSGSSAPGVQ